MDIFSTMLVVVSGICWTLVYISCIHTGFKQKTYSMPLFALGLNIAWEGLYAVTDLFIRELSSPVQVAQAIANAAWFLCDIAILVTLFLYGKKECATPMEKKLFIPWNLFCILCCVGLQLLFYFHFGSVEGEKYSAFLQNIIMSVAFLYMLQSRKSSEGQTMTIAVAKCVGTLTPTILGTLEGNTFILFTGIICFIFDVIYILALAWTKQTEKNCAERVDPV